MHDLLINSFIWREQKLKWNVNDPEAQVWCPNIGEIQLIYIHLHYVMLYSEEFRKYQALALHLWILILGKQRFQTSTLAFSFRVSNSTVATNLLILLIPSISSKKYPNFLFFLVMNWIGILVRFAGGSLLNMCCFEIFMLPAAVLASLLWAPRRRVSHPLVE